MTESATETVAEATLSQNRGFRFRVLHVDDDPSFLEIAKECLEAQGDFEVEIAYSVEEAMKKMKEKAYDAIVSDYQMPDRDGLGFLKELREGGDCTPFIIFTGKGREEVAIRALNLGAEQYLSKSGHPEAVYGELAHGIRHSVERKRSEDRTRESEEKYRKLVENSLQGIIVIQDFHIVFANQALAEITGYTTQELLSLPPERVKAMIHPEDQQLVWGRFFDRLSGKSVIPHYEFRGVRKDGTTCWIEMLASRVIYNGKPSIQGTFIDITERKRAEQVIRENQHKPEGVIKYIPEAAVQLDAEFRILDVNSRFCELFGCSTNEVLGKHINNVVVPKDKIEEAEKLDQDAWKGYASHETIRKRKDGTLIHVSISAAPVSSGDRLLGYIGIYKDITARKKAEEELEESRKHFQTLFNLTVDPVAIVDERGKILEITQRVEEITGFKREELVGKNFLRLPIAPAKTKAVMIKNVAKRIMGMNISPYEVEILTKDREILPYEINAARIDYRGKPADLVVFRDISERKKLEEKLRVVGSLTRHDVRNKLFAVNANAYLLQKKLAADPGALEKLRNIETAVEQVERIFENARTYEKLGVERLTDIVVKKTLEEATSLFSDFKGVRIEHNCTGLTVLADSLLRQVFYNLIDNSLKYGEKIKQIKVHYEERDGQIELIYEDDGIGISSDIRSNLFKEGVGKGTGYGLFMIKRICEVYGWTIQETGKQGSGARFAITIPCKNKKGETLYKLHR